MITDFRALCIELTDCLEKADWPHNYKAVFQQWVDISHAALAEPEVKRPTVMEIIELHTWLEDEWRTNNDGEDLPMVDFARAVLASWGGAR